MKTYIFKSLVAAGILAAIFIECSTAYAQQGISFFRTTRKESDSKAEKVPTVITSESLEIDVENNRAIFIGKVKVDDREMIIECEKMTIFLENEKKSETTNITNIDKDAGKQISKIVCEKDVVITRKLTVTPENLEPIQKATAGHADYDVKTGMIVMTQDPVINRGDDSLKGEVITIWRDSEKFSVRHGVQLELKSDNIKDSQNVEPEKSGENR
ncbi:MAG TPA: LptA/OstA family protein [Victivallales bacterium]|nr:LptA/OstA family protein [Victivallales bacterium]